MTKHCNLVVIDIYILMYQLYSHCSKNIVSASMFGTSEHQVVCVFREQNGKKNEDGRLEEMDKILNAIWSISKCETDFSYLVQYFVWMRNWSISKCQTALNLGSASCQTRKTAPLMNCELPDMVIVLSEEHDDENPACNTIDHINHMAQLITSLYKN